MALHSSFKQLRGRPEGVGVYRWTRDYTDYRDNTVVSPVFAKITLDERFIHPDYNKPRVNLGYHVLMWIDPGDHLTGEEAEEFLKDYQRALTTAQHTVKKLNGSN